MLDILLPAPDHLHRSIHMLRDPDRKKVAIGLETPAKTAPEVLVVKSDRTLWQAGQLGNLYLGQSRDLCADPDIARVFMHVHGAVHRFHRGMREEGDLV